MSSPRAGPSSSSTSDRFWTGLRTGKDRVRGRNPLAEILVGRPLDVEVDQLELPVFGHERGECDEAQRREGGLLPIIGMMCR